jgi:hypothetical protein
MEPVIAERFVRAMNVPCIYNQGMVVHKSHPFLAATFDLLTTQGIPVEIKYMVSRKPTTDIVMPCMYWVQCQIQIQCADSPYGYYVEYKEKQKDAPEHFRIMTVRRDQEWFDKNIGLLRQFWDIVQNYRSFFGSTE